MIEEIDSFSCFEKDVCFVFQTLGFKHQSLPLFIEVRCLLPTLYKNSWSCFNSNPICAPKFLLERNHE